METERTDLVFSALAHAARRRMLDLLVETPGLTVKDMAAHFDMSRIGVMKHLQVLEEANLLISQKQGRTRRMFFNAVPMQEIHERWSSQYSSFWSDRLLDLKGRVEGRPANKEPKSA